jgi:hypothetical protein
MLFATLFRKGPRPARARLQVESLEARTVPYSASGNLWPHPQLITLSFEPDGTDLGGQSSNLFATFNADFGSASAWQNAVLKAAQTWAQQANVNFAVVSDSGAASGTGSYQQGDPGFGDIRIGGFDFGNSNILAMGYMPPPVNNYSVAGDIAFNTAQVFNINGLDYDLYTVALHELGHALGLNHSTSTSAIMYPVYQGVDYGLYSDDVAGIQSIYGARVPDAYDRAADNGTLGTASDITSQIDPNALTAVLTGLDITTTSDKDFYKFTAPAGGSGTLALTVQSAGLSLLAPGVKVYGPDQKLIGSATGSGYLGSTLTLNVSVTAGQTYYVRVMGANTTAFGTGAYGMVLNLGTGASPSLPPPNTQTANGSPLSGGGGVAVHTGANDDYDLLTIGDGRIEPTKASARATPPQQGATSEPALPVRAALPILAPAAGASVLRAAAVTRNANASDATGMLASQDRPVMMVPGPQAGAALVTTSPADEAVLFRDEGSGKGPQTPPGHDTEEPAPEQLPFPAECQCYLGHAPSPARSVAWAGACDVCFSAAPAQDHGSTLDPQSAIVDPGSSVIGPAAVAAVLAFALAPSRGSRPAQADSRRRPALAS